MYTRCQLTCQHLSRKHMHWQQLSISAISQLVRFWPNFLYPMFEGVIIFLDQNVLGRNFFRQKIFPNTNFFSHFFFRPKIFFTKSFRTHIFFKKKILDTKCTLAQNISLHTISLDPKFLDPKVFVDPKFLRTQNFFLPKFFLRNICLWLGDFHWRQGIKPFQA